MRQLIEDLISAMEYHVEQTRPVHMTTVAIQAAKDALKAMPAAPVHCERCAEMGYDTPPAAPVQEPDELKHIGEQDCLLDVDGNAWRSLVENRGGCRCHISPPCSACSNPISEDELNEVGYTYTTPPAAQRQWVGLTERELELIDGMIAVQLDHAARCDGIANRTMAEKQKGWDMERVALLQKLKEKNT